VKWERIDGRARSLEKAAPALDRRSSQYPGRHAAGRDLVLQLCPLHPHRRGGARVHEQTFNQVRTVTVTLNALILIAIFLMVTKPGA
jgi:hypothetical protein